VGSRLFAVTPAAFEAVLWPAARGDLLAPAFMLLALLTALRYLKRDAPAGWRLAGTGAFYTLALLSKEIVYSFPLLFAMVVVTPALWGIPPARRARAVRLASLVAVVTAIMLASERSFWAGLAGTTKRPTFGWAPGRSRHC